LLPRCSRIADRRRWNWRSFAVRNADIVSACCLRHGHCGESVHGERRWVLEKEIKFPMSTKDEPNDPANALARVLGGSTIRRLVSNFKVTCGLWNTYVTLWSLLESLQHLRFWITFAIWGWYMQ
jgi:hypothetical protein